MRKNKISDALNHLDDDLITMTDDLMSGKRTGTVIKKIVMVSSSPQIRYPDYYGIDMPRLE